MNGIRKITCKLIALLTSAALLGTAVPAAFAERDGDMAAMEPDVSKITLANASFSAEITGVTITDGAVKSADVTVTGEGTATLYAAVYNLNGALSAVDSAEVNASGTVTLDKDIKFDASTQTLKCFVWKDTEPVSQAYIAGIDAEKPSATEAPATTETPGTTEAPAATDDPSATDTPEPTATPTPVPTLAPLDEGVISAFRYNDETGFTQYNNEGDAPAVISASEDGTTATALIIDTASYTDAALGYVRSSLVLAPVTGWGETPYVQVALSTQGYDNIKVSAKVGATKKGPKNYKIQYSTDGETFTDAGESAALSKNKTLTALFDKVALSGAGECEKLYIRITPDGTETLTADLALSGTSGEFAVNDILIYADATSNPTAEPEATATPEPSGGGNIHLNSTSIEVGADTYGVTVDGTTATITKSGEYTIDGTLDDGQIAVSYTPASTTDTVTLNLDGITLTNTTGNAINITSGTVTVASVADTTSTVTSTTGVGIYSAGDLEIKGAGTLNVFATAGNGIRGKESVEVGAGTLNVTAGNNGIKGDKEVKLTKKCGTVTINSTSDGIKSDNAPTVAKPSRTGLVTINGGTINITTGTSTDAATGEVSNGDGIQADTLLTIANSPVITIDAKGEAIKCNFSHLDLESTEGYSDVAETLAEGDGCIVISGGTITATAGEDAIKAAKDVTVSGGNVTINSAGDDGIQAGDVVINETTPASSERIDGTVTISDGTVNIKKAAGDGIATTLTYAQSGGTVTAVAAKDGVQAGKAYTYYDIHGSGDDETVLYETNGVVNITGGTLTVTAAGGATRSITDNDGNTTLSDIDYSCKGIKARKLIDISGGTIGVNSLDDALHSNHTLRVSGGDITVQSCDDGVHGEYYLYISDDAKIDVQKSYEGIEGSKIYISGGETYVVSTDDGANAAGDEPTDSAYTLSNVYGTVAQSSVADESYTLMAGPGGNQGGWSGGPGMNDNSASYGYLEVSGGLLYIEAEGDGFDTNGSGLISGGTVLVNGPTSGGNGVFDKGDNSSDTLVITGGTVIGAGTSDMAVTPNSATNSQAYVVSTLSSNQSAGKGIQVTNGSSEIITYVPSKAYKWIFVSTSDISSGTSYTVKYGGTVSGGTWAANYNETYGIKTGATFSGGSSASVTAATGGSSGGSSQPERPW